MLIAVNGATGAVFLAAQATTLSKGYVAIGAGHTTVAGNVAFAAAQV